MDISAQLLVFLTLIVVTTAAPVPQSDNRESKSLSFYDYEPEDEAIDYDRYEPDNDDYSSLGVEDNEISRAVPSRKRIRNRPYNSPVYYIRLPPQPYMYVPGLGYVSQPPSNPISQFVNVPVSFVANGKPSAIYQWGGGLNTFPTAAAPPPPPPPPFSTTRPKPPVVKPVKPADSTIHRLPGTYTFNGKPNDIFVLRDSYNSLYSDALQNFYP